MAVAGDQRSAGWMRFCAEAVGRLCDRPSPQPQWSAGRRRAPEAGGSREGIILWRAPRPKRERVVTSVRVARPTTLAPPGAPSPHFGDAFLEPLARLGRWRAARCGFVPDWVPFLIGRCGFPDRAVHFRRPVAFRPDRCTFRRSLAIFSRIEPNRSPCVEASFSCFACRAPHRGFLLHTRKHP